MENKYGKMWPRGKKAYKNIHTFTHTIKGKDFAEEERRRCEEGKGGEEGGKDNVCESNVEWRTAFSMF